MSPYYHSFLTVTRSYHIMVTPIGALHAEKIAEAVSIKKSIPSVPHK